jgi:hypothetical protein
VLILSTLIIFPAPVSAAQTDARYLDNIIQVSTGSTYGNSHTSHTLALDQKGVVWGWGVNFNGQLGTGVRGYQSAAVPVFQDVQKIDTSETNSFALKNDGTVWVWGQATGLQGDGTSNSLQGINDFLNPVRIKALSNIVDISSGTMHVLALKSDGTVWSWGNSNGGVLGRSEWKESLFKANTPMMVPGLKNIKSIYAGRNFSAATDKDGITWAWGTLSSYFDIVDRYVSKWEPVKLIDFPLNKIDGNGHRIYVTKKDGTLWEVQKTLKLKQIMKDVLTFNCQYLSCGVMNTAGDSYLFDDETTIRKHGLVMNPVEIKQIDFNYTTVLLKKDGTAYSYGPISYNTGNEMMNDPDYKKYANLTEKMVIEPQLRPIWKAITIKLNGQDVKLTTNPIVIKGVSFVPLRGVIERLGGQIDYDSGNITVSDGQNQLKLKIRTTAASKNGQSITLSGPPLVIKGTTMVPLRFISEGLGASVEWDEKNRFIVIAK